MAKKHNPLQQCENELLGGKKTGNNLSLELGPKMYLHKDMFSEVKFEPI